MLDNHQINYLFDYCAENGVKYYDVQTELVDHLANAIESEQKENPTLGFDEALNKVHLSFGYDGFEKMVKQKQKEASRTSLKLLWKSFKAQFQWPKIILGVIFFLSFLLIFELADKNIAGKLFKAIPVTLGFYLGFLWLRLNWIQIKSNKMFTIIQASGFAGLYLNFITILNYFSPINNWLHSSDKIVLMILSFSFALYSILGIAIIATFKQIEKNVRKEYSGILGVAK